MNLRFIERDGKKILQQQFDAQVGMGYVWEDVPLVQEPRKAREYLIEAFDNRLGPYRAWQYGESFMHYTGDRPDMSCMIKVREVLPDSPEAK